MADESQTDGKRVAIAILAGSRPSVPTDTLQGRDALEQIKGAPVGPNYAATLDAALSTLLAHRADCGFYPGNVPGVDWMRLAGWIERQRSTLGMPPNRFATRWRREWQ